MKIMADQVKRWLKRLERQEPESYEELLGAIEAFEVAEDAFCQARDLMLETMVSLGFPARGTKGEGVRENVERIERYIKGKGYIRPTRPRGRKFGTRCPTGPSALLAAAEPGSEMTMEFEEGELVGNGYWADNLELERRRGLGGSRLEQAEFLAAVERLVPEREQPHGLDATDVLRYHHTGETPEAAAARIRREHRPNEGDYDDAMQ